MGRILWAIYTSAELAAVTEVLLTQPDVEQVSCDNGIRLHLPDVSASRDDENSVVVVTGEQYAPDPDDMSYGMDTDLTFEEPSGIWAYRIFDVLANALPSPIKLSDAEGETVALKMVEDARWVTVNGRATLVELAKRSLSTPVTAAYLRSRLGHLKADERTDPFSMMAAHAQQMVASGLWRTTDESVDSPSPTGGRSTESPPQRGLATDEVRGALLRTWDDQDAARRLVFTPTRRLRDLPADQFTVDAFGDLLEPLYLGIYPSAETLALLAGQGAVHISRESLAPQRDNIALVDDEPTELVAVECGRGSIEVIERALAAASGGPDRIVVDLRRTEMGPQALTWLRDLLQRREYDRFTDALVITRDDEIVQVKP